MAEIWALSRLFLEKCDEHTDLQKYCQMIAAKYLESEKKEQHAQSVLEENIILKLDIGNLKTLYRNVTESAEAQAELDAHLSEFYQEHLKSAFDIEECEIEKLASYEEIKYELETRDSINSQQQLYCRKLKRAKKMEERNIVKKYRQKEEELSTVQTERFNLENSVNKLKAKAKDFEARQQEQKELILELTKGSIDLENIYAELYPQQSQYQSNISGSQRLSGPKASDSNNKGGLSSRLLMDFRRFKVPSISNVNITRQINKKNGLNRLLQQAEVIRKSMQTSPVVLSGNFPAPKLLGILKAPNESQKLTESPQKTVSFEDDHHKEVTSTIDDTQEATPKPPHYILDTPTASGVVVIDSEMEESLIESESKKPKIEILEEVLIKPADKIIKAPEAQTKLDQKANNKRKANDDNLDFSADLPSSFKKKCSPSETSININSKSFMDIYLDMSTETSTAPSPIFEPVKKAKQEVNKDMPKIKKKPETKKKPIEKNIETKKLEEIAKTKASKKQYDDFDNFFAGLNEDGSDANNSDQENISFDFNGSNGFAGGDDDGDISFLV